MKIKTTSLFIILALQNLFGQNADDTKSNQFFNPLKNKNHFGLNTQFAFDRLFQSRTTPIEVLYKTQKTINRATRFGIQLYYANNNERPYPNANPDWNTIETDMITGILWGKEKQNFVGSSYRWQWYYGADFNFQFTYNRRYINDGNDADNVEYDEEKFYRYSVAVIPFIGLRFEITPDIYVSADMLAIAQFEVQRVKYEQKHIPNVFPEYFRWDIHNYHGQLQFQPITRLSLFLKIR